MIEPRVERATTVLEEAVASGRISGGSVSVWEDGRFLERACRGYADRDAGQPVDETTVFRLASMTKPIVAVAILQLLERGELALDDPVSRFLPAYGRTSVRTPEQLAERAITLRDLLTHSSGLGQGPAAFAADEAVLDADAALAARVEIYASVPGGFQPGEATGYSPAVGFDILGRVIELVTGQTLEAHLREHLFGPLQMQDTTFVPTPELLARLAVLTEQHDGGLRPADVSVMVRQMIGDAPDRCYGAGGLYGTLPDYERFTQMLIGRGTWNGVSVLAEESVERLVRERALVDHRFSPTLRWGLGVLVATEDDGRHRQGSWGWSGAFGSHFLIDPRRGRAVVLMINQADLGGAASPIIAALERALF